MFPTFVTILPLTIPANYRLSSQFLSVGLKVGVHVWLMQTYLFATVWYCKSVRYGMYRKIRKFDFNCSMPQQFDIILIRDIDYLWALLCTCRDKKKNYTQYPFFLMMR